MRKLIGLGALLCAMAIASVAAAAPPPAIRESVAVCDPNAPTHCTAPGYGPLVSATITRPANTTQYTALTAFANATSAATFTTFANVCMTSGGQALDADIVFLDSANQTTKLSGILFLFSVAPGTALNDNATFSIASADAAHLVAQIPFSASTVTNQGSGASGSAMAEVQGQTYQFNCAPGATSLYGMVEVVNTYTPISGEVLTVMLKPLGAN